ncbi:MAG: KpsF/GutQ family sugar-phosphate isomerase [Paludibacteraceae bacterium]|nr:KpsF/GutQ family sugar-phosphate isomerase [Paludibacteraceae bacterium]
MNFDIINEAKRVFDTEILALQKTRDALDSGFATIVDLVLKCQGKVILTGMGKPGHIATKIAASLASLGTPSFFMHPGEAMHGDLGMVDRKDIVVLMSYSGESDEVVNLLPVLDKIGCTTVAISGRAKSSLVRGCNYHFIFPDFEEACYMHLAPTSSTTALLVLGDALAVVASRAKNYTSEDFGLHHPAGALGKKLLVHVENIMHEGAENAVVPEGTIIRNAIVEMSSKGLGTLVVVDAENHLKGIITDGDLRRMLERGVDIYKDSVEKAMTVNPLRISPCEMAVNALQIMNDRKITALPVVDDDNKLVGTLKLQDILNAGIVK